MLISISVMLKRDFCRNILVYKGMTRIYIHVCIIHCGPSFQQVKNTLYMYNIRATFRDIQF